VRRVRAARSARAGLAATPATARTLNVNGVDRTIPVGPGDTLLTALRGLGLRGAKLSCGRGECGACTVLVDDLPVVACTVLAARVTGAVVTVEGVSEECRQLRSSFADHAGFQCGFCTPGMIMSAVALLRSGSPLSAPQIRQSMSGNLCRCTGYGGIVEAIGACSPSPEPADQSSMDSSDNSSVQETR
jgi:aerobic-type carbon monoxide dehydrogenase small subunit (CoxS/CutS family)